MTDENAELEKAATTAAMAALDPLTLAKQNAELRSSVKGAHAIVFALVQRLGSGPLRIERAEWQAPDPQLELQIETAKDGSVTLSVVRRRNLAIRPKRGRRT